MAVCEIWDVRGRLDHPIDYAENPEKTANPKYSDADLQAMVDVMEYATNKDKTEQRFFVTGVNCDPATARDEMMIANPFVYLRNDNDVQRLVTNLFKATTPKGAQSQDPFWDTAASMLLLSLVFYLKYEAPPDEQNFPMVMELLRAGEVREDDDSYVSPLDELFDRLEMVNPEHIALKYYRDYHSGSAKTLKSIQITLAARLEKFNLESLASLTATDELDLPSLGEKKVALFALIPDNDTTTRTRNFMRNTRPFSLTRSRSTANMKLSPCSRPLRTAWRASATMIL